jgi:hypothetical protein
VERAENFPSPLQKPKKRLFLPEIYYFCFIFCSRVFPPLNAEQEAEKFLLILGDLSFAFRSKNRLTYVTNGFELVDTEWSGWKKGEGHDKKKRISCSSNGARKHFPVIIILFVLLLFFASLFN